MKLYDYARAPNPRRVRIFLAEKGVSVDEVVEVDLAAFAHREPAFAKLNPFARVPVLELDDGTVIAETMAICRYIEDTHPEPPLFGTDAKDRALVEMWNRHMELDLLYPVAMAFRHLHPGMAEHEKPQVREWGEINAGRALASLAILNGRLAASPFVAGQAFTVADITGGIALDMMKAARITVPPELTHVARWHAALRARPSWSA
jgi:glutathione S-transferase